MALATPRLCGQKAHLGLTILAFVGLSVATAGCGTTNPTGAIGTGVVGNDFEAPARDLIGVKTLTANYIVRVSGGYVTQAEHVRLDEFVTGFARNRPESLRVALSGAASPAQYRAVADILVADGVEPRSIVMHRSAVRPGILRGSVVLNVERAVAVVPNCPGWVDHISAPADNSTNLNFGCSDVSNFAATVADPHDLREGESNIYGDGERGAKSVADYRADKVKDLPPVNEQFQVVPSGGK